MRCASISGLILRMRNYFFKKYNLLLDFLFISMGKYKQIDNKKALYHGFDSLEDPLKVLCINSYLNSVQMIFRLMVYSHEDLFNSFYTMELDCDTKISVILTLYFRKIRVKQHKSLITIVVQS